MPILDVRNRRRPGTPAGLVTRATLVVDAGWVDDAIRAARRSSTRTRRTVEIEIRGDFIVDCNGQTIDANAVGLSPAPTGQRHAGRHLPFELPRAAARYAESRGRR